MTSLDESGSRDQSSGSTASWEHAWETASASELCSCMSRSCNPASHGQGCPNRFFNLRDTARGKNLLLSARHHACPPT